MDVPDYTERVSSPANEAGTEKRPLPEMDSITIENISEEEASVEDHERLTKLRSCIKKAERCRQGSDNTLPRRIVVQRDIRNHRPVGKQCGGEDQANQMKLLTCINEGV